MTVGKNSKLFAVSLYECSIPENKIRPLALGSKNYLFTGSHSSTLRIAMLCSLFGTCATHRNNPSNWLLERLEKIADTNAPKTVTLNPAIYFGLEEDLGPILEEKRANLVMLTANPLDNIANSLSSVLIGNSDFHRTQ